jgi:hypothetical protein
MTDYVDRALIPAKARRSDPRWSQPLTDARPKPNSETADGCRRDPSRGGLPAKVSRAAGSHIPTSPAARRGRGTRYRGVACRNPGDGTDPERSEGRRPRHAAAEGAAPYARLGQLGPEVAA